MRGETPSASRVLARARTRNGPLTDHNGDRGGRRGAVLGAAVERGSHRSAQGEADERRHPGRLHPPTGHLGADEGCDISYPAHVFTEPRSAGWAGAPRVEGELRAARRCCVLGCVVPGICIRDLRFRPCVPTNGADTIPTVMDRRNQRRTLVALCPSHADAPIAPCGPFAPPSADACLDVLRSSQKA